MSRQPGAQGAAGRLIRHLAVFGLLGPPLGNILFALTLFAGWIIDQRSGSRLAPPLRDIGFIALLGYPVAYVIGGPPALIAGTVAACLPRSGRTLFAFTGALVGGLSTLLVMAAVLSTDLQPDWILVGVGAAAAAACSLLAYRIRPLGNLRRKSPAPESGADLA